MKKLQLIFVLVMGISSLFASEGFEVGFEQPSSSEYVLNFSLGEYDVTTVNKDGNVYSKINFVGNIFTKDAGYAEVPFINASIQISNRNNVSTEIINSRFVELELSHPLLPSRGTIYRNQDPSTIPYKIADEAIVDEFYPINLAEPTEPFIIRDVRGVSVYVYPFQYNPVQQILRIYTDVSVKLTDNNSTPVNPLYITQKIAPEMNNLYRSAFINYETSRFENEVDDFGSILVIYTTRDAAAIAPYVTWKREMGFTVYEEEVSTGTNVQSLISTQFNANNDILYVQIVGDWADISGTTSGGAPTDPNLGCVIGTDVYPDIIIGRFSAGSAAQVTVQVDKTITYERDPDPTGDWYHKGLGIGSEQGSTNGDDNEADYVHIDVIKEDKLLPFTYTEVAEAYQFPSTAQVSGPVNNGLSVINYCGHGSMTSWVTSSFNNSHVNNLSNGDALPFIISVACVNGAFHNGECFAEAWLKKSGGGAVGMYASTVNQSWAPPMRGQDYIADLLIGGYDYSQHPGQSGTNTDVQKMTFGSICINGSILMTLEEFAGGSGEMKHWTIFGDASLQVRTDTPSEISLSNENIFMGMEFTTIVSANGSPVEGAMITLSQNDDFYTGITDDTGSVTIDHGLEVGTCKMVVTGFNLDTIYDEDMEILPLDVAYVILDSYELFDDNNNIPEFDESMIVDIYLSNVGVENSADLEITLTTEDDYITITDGQVSRSAINAGATVLVEDAFSFEIANNIPDQHSVSFVMEIVGDETWISNFNVTVNAPAFEAGAMVINDAGGDGLLDPGETATLSIPISNIGNAASADLYVTMNSASPDLITITNGTYNTDGLGISEQTIATFDIEVDENAPEGTIATLAMLVNSGGYSSAFTFFPAIGMVIEDFESGDFSSFEWEMGQFGYEISSSNPNAGTYCAQTVNIADNQTASISVTMDVPSDGEIKFYRKVSSEANYDYLKFYINDIEQGEWAGTVAWSQVTYNVSAGTDVEFTWAFEKDYTVSSGQDCAWLDDIEFPASGGGEAAIINVSTTIIEFGEAELGETIDSEFTIFNLGNIDLFGSITCPDGFSVNIEDYLVEPNSNIVVTATFAPTQGIDYSGDIVISSNDLNQSEMTIAVSGTGVSVGNDLNLIPTVTELNGNYPNPFNPSTNIKFSLKADSKVTLEIFNVRGQKVRTLVNDNISLGYHNIVWNGLDDSNRNVSSGIYFSSLKASDGDTDYTSVKKMILMK